MDAEFNPTEEQRKAIETAAASRVMLLTGGPGTGKTFTTKLIADMFERLGYSVRLCAPTGRAAARMSELTGRDGNTIHRLLWVSGGFAISCWHGYRSCTRHDRAEQGRLSTPNRRMSRARLKMQVIGRIQRMRTRAAERGGSSRTL